MEISVGFSKRVCSPRLPAGLPAPSVVPSGPRPRKGSVHHARLSLPPPYSSDNMGGRYHGLRVLCAPGQPPRLKAGHLQPQRGRPSPGRKSAPCSLAGGPCAGRGAPRLAHGPHRRLLAPPSPSSRPTPCSLRGALLPSLSLVNGTSSRKPSLTHWPGQGPLTFITAPAFSSGRLPQLQTLCVFFENVASTRAGVGSSLPVEFSPQHVVGACLQRVARASE